MIYYSVAIIGKSIEELVYQSTLEINAGQIVKVALRSKILDGVVLKKENKPEFKCLDILEVKDLFISQKNINFASFISKYYSCFLSDALNLFTPSNVYKYNISKLSHSIRLDLSAKQQDAVEFFKQQNRMLLFGNTGTGKTEIYITLANKAINEGKQVLILMPEIGLAPQTFTRFKNYFHDLVGIWHSKITKKQKEETLYNIENGKIRVIIGTRSALFLPLSSLDLIIVDEEHDDSFKSNKKPRYNARDLAIWYSKTNNISLVLGSATPSLNSYKNFPIFRLKSSFYSFEKKIMFDESYGLSPLIISQIEQTLFKNEQVIVFLPTRANFKFISCYDCGQNIECPNCSVGMSLHSDKNMLLCHYCNASMPIPKICPNCKSENLKSTRFGTAQILKELEEFFPSKNIVKFDKDEQKNYSKLKKTLKEFNDKKIDILVGTQMLAKGHDYHGVTLSVILEIDNLLHIPTFRANEKALALAMQVSGRAGRSSNSTTIIQTKNKDFFEYILDDYENFIKDELNFRKPLFPPYKRFLKVLIANKKKEKCELILENILMIKNIFSNLELINYGPSNVSLIANKYRYECLVRSSNIKELLQFGYMSKKFDVEIDIDPIE